MSQAPEIALRILFIGTGATALTDIWNLVLKHCGVPTLDLAFLGRWVGHFPEGRWSHARIAAVAPVKGERWLGWCLHYGIGIAFAALAVALFGPGWARHPSLLPALGIGVATVAAPLLVMQPALGAGIASSKTSRPFFNSAKSLVNHTIFGFGLYLAALAAAELIPAAG